MAMKIAYGDAGYFYVPDARVGVPLYDKGKRKSAQTVVDMENSAVLCRNFGGGHCNYIADHASQGFSKLRRCNIDTIAFIQTPQETQFLYPVAITTGSNLKTELVTASGQKVSRLAWADYCVYFCNDSTGKSITMLFYKKGARLKYPLFDEVYTE